MPDNRQEIEFAYPWIALLKPGMIITHKRCCDCIEEHYFQKLGSLGWIVGLATHDTKLIEGIEDEGYANDISPKNVTHINRVPANLFHLTLKKSDVRLEKESDVS